MGPARTREAGPILASEAPSTRHGAAIRIGSNENPYGPGASALSAIQEALPEANRYAFQGMADTVDAIAAHLGVPRTHVALGCGSSEILEAAVSAFTSRDAGLVTASPTFELPADRAHGRGAPVVRGAGRCRWAARSRRRCSMRRRAAGSVYVCNPNNPTSTVHAAADVAAFIAGVHERSPEATVLVDEAYHDYVDMPAYATAIPLATADPRVMVARTFSKIHGMAGLRVGYAVGQPSTLQRLRPWLGGMTMSVLASAAARASLADGAHIDRQRSLNREVKAFTLAALARAGCTAYASEANFVMVDVGRDCRSFAAACASRDVRVGRPFPPLDHYARITLGTMDEMTRATTVFAEILAVRPDVTARWPRPDWLDDIVQEC